MPAKQGHCEPQHCSGSIGDYREEAYRVLVGVKTDMTNGCSFLKKPQHKPKLKRCALR